MVSAEKEFGWSAIRERLARQKYSLELHEGQQNVSLHDHTFLELTYILRGSAEHTLDGHTATLHEGDYLIVDYGSRHSYRAIESGGYDNLDCLFLPELLDPILKGTQSLRLLLEHYLLHFNMQVLAENPAHMVFHDDTGRIRGLLEQIRGEDAARAAGYTEMIRCCLIEILLLTMRNLEDARTAAAGQDISSVVTAYVAEHYMEPLTLQELASKLNYSLPYVSKRFREDVGVSFVRYLQNYRVMQACRLLSSTNRSLAEITEMVGYRDTKWFSELIRRTTGLSPSELRRRG